MAIFSVSDIVIAVTLIVNALALISTKLPGQQKTAALNSERGGTYTRLPTSEGRGDDAADKGDNGDIGDVADSSDDYCSASTLAEQLMNPTAAVVTNAPSGGPIVTRLRSLVHGMRKYSCVIVVWNIFFVVLMVFVFGN